MTIEILYWLLMILWFLYGLYWNSADLRVGRYGNAGTNLFVFVLLVILGWQIFGSPIKS